MADYRQPGECQLPGHVCQLTVVHDHTDPTAPQYPPDEPGAELALRPSAEIEVRSETLRALQAVLLGMDEQRRELAEAGDYETLSAGAQDLAVITKDITDLLRDTRRDIADIVDKMQGNLSSDESYYYGVNRIEVPGVGVVEVNGGWTRTKWRSEALLHHLVTQAIEGCEEVIVNADGEPVVIRDSCVVTSIMEVVKDTMPLTASLSWKVGQEKKGGEVTGLKRHGVDDEDWCERTPKERLATVPNHPLTERKKKADG